MACLLVIFRQPTLISSKSRSAIDVLKRDLSSEFEMKDLGEAKKVLGMKITQDRRVGNELDTEGVFAKGTSEVQHRQGCEVFKYTTGSSFQVIC